MNVDTNGLRNYAAGRQIHYTNDWLDPYTALNGSFVERVITLNDILIGFSASATQDGRQQADGAVAFLIDGRIYSISEERLSRQKHDGNVWRGLCCGAEHFGFSMSHVSQFIISTCGEAVPFDSGDVPIRSDSRLGLLDLQVDASKVAWAASHHESHAFEALHAAASVKQLLLPALIFVADRCGQPSEHQSAYLFDGRSLVLVWRGIPTFDRLQGFGLVYDRVTEHLGWRENFDSGKTMALSGFAKPHRLEPMFFELSSDHFEVKLPNDFTASNEILSVVVPRNPTIDALLQGGARLAGQLQFELETVIISLFRTWRKAYAPKTLIAAGGLATNCRLLGKLARENSDVTVLGSLAPGDMGQGIGNIVGTVFRETGILLGEPTLATRSGFWPGRRAPIGLTDRDRSLVSDAAEAMLSGSLLLVCENDLEPGPRALGLHSILADARDKGMHARLNKLVKRRENFRPFGALLTREGASRWFGRSERSPFMDLALPSSPEFARLYPAVVHVDGTARIQSAGSMLMDTFAAYLLQYLSRVHGIEAVLNTSLNGPGEPIILEPHCAQRLATEIDLRCVLITDAESGSHRWHARWLDRVCS